MNLQDETEWNSWRQRGANWIKSGWRLRAKLSSLWRGRQKQILPICAEGGWKPGEARSAPALPGFWAENVLNLIPHTGGIDASWWLLMVWLVRHWLCTPWGKQRERSGTFCGLELDMFMQKCCTGKGSSGQQLGSQDWTVSIRYPHPSFTSV